MVHSIAHHKTSPHDLNVRIISALADVEQLCSGLLSACTLMQPITDRDSRTDNAPTFLQWQHDHNVVTEASKASQTVNAVISALADSERGSLSSVHVLYKDTKLAKLLLPIVSIERSESSLTLNAGHLSSGRCWTRGAILGPHPLQGQQAY